MFTAVDGWARRNVPFADEPGAVRWWLAITTGGILMHDLCENRTRSFLSAPALVVVHVVGALRHHLSRNDVAAMFVD
jgi:hypothetical protein